MNSANRLPDHRRQIEAIHAKCVDTINDLLIGMQDDTEVILWGAIERSGMDLSPCSICNKLVVCIPDGLPICEPCAVKESKR